MLLGSNALAAAPLVADPQHPYAGVLAVSQLTLTAVAIQVAAALFTGASAARQGKPVQIKPVFPEPANSIRISENRTITL